MCLLLIRDLIRHSRRIREILFRSFNYLILIIYHIYSQMESLPIRSIFSKIFLEICYPLSLANLLIRTQLIQRSRQYVTNNYRRIHLMRSTRWVRRVFKNKIYFRMKVNDYREDYSRPRIIVSWKRESLTQNLRLSSKLTWKNKPRKRLTNWRHKKLNCRMKSQWKWILLTK